MERLLRALTALTLQALLVMLLLCGGSKVVLAVSPPEPALRPPIPNVATLPVNQQFEAGEQFVRKMEIAAGLPNRHVEVFFDPKATSCGWANSVAGHNLIGLEPTCWKNHGADYQVAVLAHELGHIHRGHAQTTGLTTKVKQLQADELGGYAVGMMGGSLRQALAHAATTDTSEAGPDPSRPARIEATTRGWRLSQNELRDQEPFWKPEAVRQSAPPARQTIFGIDVHSFLIGSVCTFALVIFLGRGR